MNITEKLIKSHLVSGEMIPGKEIAIKIDQTLTQDSTGTMAYLPPRTWRRRGAVKACPASRRAACPCGSAARRRAALWRRACGARRNG